MRMRLKPLRGQTYEKMIFMKMIGIKTAQVLSENHLINVHIDILNLPIIDTKDYEKIPDEKYAGH